MVDMDVIVRQDEPTEWVSSMVVVVKPNKIRICIDPEDLNRAINREHYPMQTVDDIVTRMPNAKVFSIIDASSGFWQIQLDHVSSLLCTFNTPFGRYRFKRLPFGVCSASEVFQKQMSEMFEDIDVVFVCWSLTSLCHSNGHIETIPAREINPFTAPTRIRSQLLRTQ